MVFVKRERIILLFLLLLRSNLFGQGWREVCGLNFPRTGLVCVVVNGKIYAIGGRDENRVSGICEEYDPIRDTWILKSPMPTPRYGAVVGVWEGKIYVIGGDTSIRCRQPTNIIEAYVPQRDTWERINSFLPTPRSGMSGSLLSNLLFVMGGKIGENFTDTVEVYDLRENTWLIRRSMLTPRASFAAVGGDRIYALGGFYQGPLRVCEVYNESSNSWQVIKRLPFSNFGAAGCVYCGRIFLLGGVERYGQPSRKVLYYLPASDSWVEYFNLNHPRANLSACVLGGEIYAVGGDSFGWVSGKTEKTTFSGIEEGEVEGMRREETTTFLCKSWLPLIRRRYRIFNPIGWEVRGDDLKRGVYFLIRKDRKGRVRKGIFN